MLSQCKKVICIAIYNNYVDRLLRVKTGRLMENGTKINLVPRMQLSNVHIKKSFKIHLWESKCYSLIIKN